MLITLILIGWSIPGPAHKILPDFPKDFNFERITADFGIFLKTFVH
jgi:hypothetical protein